MGWNNSWPRVKKRSRSLIRVLSTDKSDTLANEVIDYAKAHNAPIARHDPTAHAEIVAIRSAKWADVDSLETLVEAITIYHSVPSVFRTLSATLDGREDRAGGVFLRARLPRRDLRRFARFLVAEAHAEPVRKAR